jgi:hypothetical protein
VLAALLKQVPAGKIIDGMLQMKGWIAQDDLRCLIAVL